MIEFKYKFIEDANDLLNELETTLLELEKKPNDSKLIEEVFRAMHTLKGSAAMFGFAEIGELTHRAENVYDLIRNGRIKVDKEILNLTLETVDFIHKVLEADENTNFAKDFQLFKTKIENLLANVDANIFDGNQQEILNISEQSKGLQSWFITIIPKEDLRSRGIKIHAIFDEINENGKNHVFHRYNDKNADYGMFWEIILETEHPLEDIEDIFLFIDDITIIKSLKEGTFFDANYSEQIIEELSKIKSIDLDKLSQMIQDAENPTEVDEPAENTTVELPEIETQKHESIKVSAQRLDEQMTFLSDLVTIRSEIQLIVHKNGYQDLSSSVEKLDKITRNFRKNIFKIRLIPLNTLELHFNRLIRDLSGKLAKSIDFHTEGMNTELDKTIIDNLESPLMHLIRNCIDHGIEAADLRKMRNKPPKGNITLSARQAAADVLITVSDDGEGIDTAIIHKKAVQKGLIKETDQLSKNEYLNLIFYPGFTTARNLTEVSGRGVGMDVVKQTVNSLRGTIEIQSELKVGTSFTIKLPLTLSIIDTMLVMVDSMYYSIPLTEIDKCTEIANDELNNYDNNHIAIDGQLYTYTVLKDKFNIRHNTKYRKDNLHTTNYQDNNLADETINTNKSKVVIVRNGTSKLALVVDAVIGEHQAVLKPLGEYFKKQNYISGASQLADGHIAYVLDTTKLN